MISYAVLGVAAAIVAASVGVTPRPETAMMFGWELPSLCFNRWFTGHDCPGCGMIRGFAFMARLEFEAARAQNSLAPGLFLAVLAQIPIQLWVIWRRFGFSKT